MKPLELLWFENISAFHEPVLALGPIRASMKQLLYTLLALALALSLLNFAKNPALAVAVPAFLLMLAYARPYGQGFEELLIDMISFFGRKKSMGVVSEEEKKEKVEKEKKKEKEKEKEEVTTTPTLVSAPEPTPVPEIVSATITVPTHEVKEPEIPVLTVPTVKTTTLTTDTNLLHYMVPSSKDFDLEIADKEYIIATGESTVHINNEDHSNAIIVIEIKDKAITRLIVNKQ